MTFNSELERAITVLGEKKYREYFFFFFFLNEIEIILTKLAYSKTVAIIPKSLDCLRNGKAGYSHGYSVWFTQRVI